MTTKTKDPETPTDEAIEAPDTEARSERKRRRTADEKASLRAELEREVERLENFKRENIKKGDHTPCPACATLIHINANKCRHCSSDVAAQNALTREILRKLDEVSAELAALSPAGPVLSKIKGFASRPTLRPEMKILFPSFAAYFALIVTLRYVASPILFWTACAVGPVAGFFVLNRLRYAKFVTVESYRSILVIGILIAMGGALMPGRGEGRSVVVIKPVANIRQVNTTESPVVATAQEGDRLLVFGEDSGWYNVRTADGTTGWIYATLVGD